MQVEVSNPGQLVESMADYQGAIMGEVNDDAVQETETTQETETAAQDDAAALEQEADLIEETDNGVRPEDGPQPDQDVAPDLEPEGATNQPDDVVVTPQEPEAE